ncbi:MAG: DUF1761 domain-containing protein [Saprospiraceae bacterium]|nr:DUF1761 domain-containing protein [Saprospiraceae bacterium]
MKNQILNPLAILVSVVVLFPLGFLWYGPLFGEPWMNHVGLDMATVEANPPGAGVWIANVLSSVIQMVALAWILLKAGGNTWVKGALIGLVIGFAFNHLPGMLNNMYADRPYGLSWITGGYSIVGLAIAGAILGGWKKFST